MASRSRASFNGFAMPLRRGLAPLKPPAQATDWQCTVGQQLAVLIGPDRDARTARQRHACRHQAGSKRVSLSMIYSSPPQRPTAK